MDILSDFLSRFVFSGWSWDAVSLAGTMGVCCDERELHFYIVRSGQCCVESEGTGTSILLNAHDHLILFRGRSYRFLAIDESADSQSASSPTDCRSQLLCARFLVPSSELKYLLHLFPDAVHVSDGSCPEMESVRKFVYAISDSSTIGNNAVVSRALQLLFLLSFRAYVLQEPNTGGCLLLNLLSPLGTSLDTKLSELVELLHSEPESNWSVNRMARQVKMSRSAFAERFRSVVGQAPVDYLTDIRMRKASELLRDGNLSVKRIAKLVGYESESAFSSAFKRRIGESPMTFRQCL